MKNFIFVLLSLLCVDYFLCQEWKLKPYQQKIIDSLLVDFPINTEIAIAFIDSGHVNFLGLVKNQNLIYQPIENSLSVFEIGSISKVFTSTLLCQLHIDHKLDIDDQISKHSRLKFQGSPRITFKNLSNHTSGLPRLPNNIFNSMSENPKNPYLNYQDEDLKTYLKNDLKLLYPVGEKCEYSNLGAGLLGYILASINKTTYEELIQEKIFRPLNMQHSTCIRKNAQGTQIKALDVNGNESSYWEFSVLVGAGGILSTANDLSNFVLANLDTLNPVYKLQQKESFQINENFSIALGWHIIKNGATNFYWHNGATGGFRSSLTMDVKQKNGVIILSNVCPQHKKSENIDKLSIELIKTLYK